LNFAIHRHNEGVVTYGVRAGSTRDLGFATAFVDMSGFYFTIVDRVECMRRDFYSLIVGSLSMGVPYSVFLFCWDD